MALGADVGSIRVGPGWLYMAELGTPEPISLTGAIDVGFIPLGYTDEGSEFSLGMETEPLTVAELLGEVAEQTINRAVSVSFALAQLTAKNLYFALNGGDIEVDGQFIKYEPPELGAERYFMLLWQDQQNDADVTERWLFRRVRNTSPSAIPRRKGAQKAVIPVTMKAYEVTGSTPYTVWLHPSLSGLA